MTYSPLIFICVTLYAKRVRRPLNQRFLMAFSRLVFVCVGFLTQQLKISRKYTTIKQWLKTKCPNSVLTPQSTFFLMTHSSLIFVWLLYALRMSTHTKNKRKYTTLKLWLRTNCTRYRHYNSLPRHSMCRSIVSLSKVTHSLKGTRQQKQQWE